MLFGMSASAVNGQINKLIVIDPLIAGETVSLVTQLPVQKVLRLPDKGNPITLITDELKNEAYSEIHLYLLTKPGTIIFDEINILADNVQDYSADFTAWKNLLGSGSKVIIHSESLTTVPEGSQIVQKISEFIGRSITVEK